MKSRPILSMIVLVAVTGVLVETAQAAWHYRYAQYRRRKNPPRSQSTNQVAKPTEPQDKPVKFKDLPDNAEFYYLADKDHKNFPYVKISATAAKSVPTAAKPQATVTTVPVETLVIQKKDTQKKDADKKDQKSTKASKQS
jgi:hypothetical protein